MIIGQRERLLRFIATGSAATVYIGMAPMMHSPVLGFFNMPHGVEWLVILGIALLLFGKRLPEVARSIGRGVVEFKRGLKGIEDDVHRPEYQDDKRPTPPVPPSTQPPQPPGQPS